jgi:hypothetical protein
MYRTLESPQTGEADMSFSHPVRQLTVLCLAMGTVAALALGLTACGGGEGGVFGKISSNSTGSSDNTNSSSSSSSTGGTAGANVVAAEVDRGPTGLQNAAANILYVTVTICAPGSTTNCQSIPYVQVDTGSYGLRIIGSVLNASLYSALPAETSTVAATSGQPLAECTQWADGYSWGPLVTADMQIADQAGSAGESANGIPVQVIGATNYTRVPTDCTNTGPNGEEDSVATFGANGIIGVGPFVQDCGPSCSSGAGVQATYYTCATPGACTDSAGGGNYTIVTAAQQASNPIAYFATDNNGLIIELPSAAAKGQATVTGSLVFGIDTESNNQVGSAMVLPASPDYGTVTTTFNGTALNGSYFDTGSNGLFFSDSSITQCSGDSFKGFYCPSSAVDLSATVEGCTSANSASLGCTATSSPTDNVSFSVANPMTFTEGNTAFPELAGTAPSLPGSSKFTGFFDWGLPFFYGQSIYVAIACTGDSGVPNCASSSAPFFAVRTN